MAAVTICSAYKINKQDDNIQPCRTPFWIWNQYFIPCPSLTVASWPAYRFLRRQVRWSGMVSHLFKNFPQYAVIHTVCGFPLFICIALLISLPYLSMLFSGTLHSVGYIFPFPICLLILFFAQLFVKPPQTTTLPSSFGGIAFLFWGDNFGHCLLYNVMNPCP